jgi:hypothetical protein
VVVHEVEHRNLNVGEKMQINVIIKSFGYEDGIKNSCVLTPLPFCKCDLIIGLCFLKMTALSLAKFDCTLLCSFLFVLRLTFCIVPMKCVWKSKLYNTVPV